MKVFNEFLAKIDNPDQRYRMEEVLSWVNNNFQGLEPVMKWNQPMFTDHGTYIIGFSAAKNHFSVAPERVTMERYLDDIVNAGYDHTKELIRIKWSEPIDYSLLGKIIEFNRMDKAEYTNFWRK
ncbi:iron chaperone [Ornithinibacillus contaminans]|uniref:iron chaperone n=1 Tax=Ornithinibacillus contaminans TaxID=694055 RepID=UPI00064DE9CC|nr:iron chaperone [Ornithinibacillus contaminans]